MSENGEVNEALAIEDVARSDPSAARMLERWGDVPRESLPRGVQRRMEKLVERAERRGVTPAPPEVAEPPKP